MFVACYFYSTAIVFIYLYAFMAETSEKSLQINTVFPKFY